MWKGYLRFGETEIGNTARAIGYAATAECRASWIQPANVGGIREALGESEYTHRSISDAPWYDPREEESGRFYGGYVLSATLTGSTRTGGYTEGIADGGVADPTRHTGRQVRVRMWLTAFGLDALEYGQSWLESALAGSRCSMHEEGGCEETDLMFFTHPPAPRGTEESDEAYATRIRKAKRHLHDVTCISGPIPVQTAYSSDRRHVGREVEFTLYAAVPWIFGETRELSLQPTLPVVVQDIPYNLVTHPSAELAGPDVIVARNLDTNPSLEVDAAGWSASYETITGSDPTANRFSSGRSADVAAVGTQSFRARLVGNNVGASGQARVIIQREQAVAYEPGLRASVTIWAAAFVTAGPGSLLKSVRAVARWYNGATLLREDVLGTTTTEFGGRAYSNRSQPVPVGTTRCVRRVELVTDWRSDTDPALNYDVRLYADAAGVTVP